METLNNAARAAGYAMATADELLDSARPEPKAADAPWRPGEAVISSLIAPPPAGTLHALTGWLKGRVFGVFGRGAPA
jgi:hypothetical protein